jgi:hypothetical protein
MLNKPEQKSLNSKKSDFLSSLKIESNSKTRLSLNIDEILSKFTVSKLNNISQIPAKNDVILNTFQHNFPFSAQSTKQHNFLSFRQFNVIQPSLHPLGKLIHQPSSQPSGKPTTEPSSFASHQPTFLPIGRITTPPTSNGQPSGQPSGQPTSHPTRWPTTIPTGQPSGQPSSQPSGQPTPTTSPHFSLHISLQVGPA